MISLGLRLTRPTKAGFSPLSLSPALWLDASDATTLYQSNGGSLAAADGDPVGYWMDKSGNGNHASQTSGTNKPLLKTNIKNSRPVIRGNGTSASVKLANTVINTNFDFFIVQRKLTTSSGALATSRLFSNGDGSQGQNTFSMCNSGVGKGMDYYIIRPAAGSADINLSAVGITTGWCLHNVKIATGGSVARVNGAQQGTSTATNVGTPPLPLNFFAGYSNNTGTVNQWSDTDIAEALLFPVLSTTDRSSVEAYLNAKWSIY